MVIYDAVNQGVLRHIPQTAQRILDIGCGSGILGRELKQRDNCQVVGITYSEVEAALAAKHLDKVLVCDLNDFRGMGLDAETFDCVVCSHVLEHLYYPQDLLKKLRTVLKPDFTLVVALPNTLNWKQRLEFLKGNFKYTDGGLMDRTHFRFFDWETALELLESSGYTVTDRITDGYFPLPAIRQFAKPMALQIDKLATGLLPGLFGVQFILLAHPSI